MSCSGLLLVCAFLATSKVIWYCKKMWIVSIINTTQPRNDFEPHRIFFFGLLNTLLRFLLLVCLIYFMPLGSQSIQKMLLLQPDLPQPYYSRNKVRYQMGRSSIWISCQQTELAKDIAVGACSLAPELIFMSKCTAILCHVYHTVASVPNALSAVATELRIWIHEMHVLENFLKP